MVHIKQKFRAYADSQHGWVAVKRKVLSDLGILEQISAHSYQKGKTVYLEEDMDLHTFVVAYERVHGSRPEYIEKYTDGQCRVRYYERFTL